MVNEALFVCFVLFACLVLSCFVCRVLFCFALFCLFQDYFRVVTFKLLFIITLAACVFHDLGLVTGTSRDVPLTLGVEGFLQCQSKPRFLQGPPFLSHEKVSWKGNNPS